MPAPKGHEPYNKNGEGGAPELWTEEKLNELADEFTKWWHNPYNVWFKDFALEKYLHPNVLALWAHKNDRFKAAYEYAKEMQQTRLVNGSLKRTFHDAACARVLAHSHGWSKEGNTTIVNNNIDPYQKLMNNVTDNSKDLVNERNDK